MIYFNLSKHKIHLKHSKNSVSSTRQQNPQNLYYKTKYIMLFIQTTCGNRDLPVFWYTVENRNTFLEMLTYHFNV